MNQTYQKILKERCFGAHCIWENFYYIWCKVRIIIQTVEAGTAPSNGAIWDEFSEQH
jgi:hypothetical protein